MNESTVVLNRAQAYSKSAVAKSLRVSRQFGKGEAVQSFNYNQLVCLMIYTDYAKSSSDFTRSFCKLGNDILNIIIGASIKTGCHTFCGKLWR